MLKYKCENAVYGMKKSMKPIPPKLVRAVAHAPVVRKVEQAWNKRMAVHGVRYAPIGI
jgi:hypothetical protein